jgi:hypothetical protein
MAKAFHARLPGSGTILEVHVDDAGLLEAAETCCDGLIDLYGSVTPEYLDLVHSYGLSLYLGSVPPAALAEVIASGVDGLVGSGPHLLAAELAGRPEPQCSDGIDNNGDGLTDYPDDPTCASPEDDKETGDLVHLPASSSLGRVLGALLVALTAPFAVRRPSRGGS